MLKEIKFMSKSKNYCTYAMVNGVVQRAQFVNFAFSTIDEKFAEELRKLTFFGVSFWEDSIKAKKKIVIETGKTGIDESEKKEETKEEAPEEPVKIVCEICGRKFDTKTAFDTHTKIEHKKQSESATK